MGSNGLGNLFETPMLALTLLHDLFCHLWGGGIGHTPHVQVWDTKSTSCTTKSILHFVLWPYHHFDHALFCDIRWQCRSLSLPFRSLWFRISTINTLPYFVTLTFWPCISKSTLMTGSLRGLERGLSEGYSRCRIGLHFLQEISPLKCRPHANFINFPHPQNQGFNVSAA